MSILEGVSQMMWQLLRGGGRIPSVGKIKAMANELANTNIKYKIPGSLRTVVPIWGDDDRGRWVGQGYTRGGRGTAPTPSTNLEQQNSFRIFDICSHCLLIAIKRKRVWLRLIFVLPGRRDQHVAFYCWGWLCLLWALKRKNYSDLPGKVQKWWLSSIFPLVYFLQAKMLRCWMYLIIFQKFENIENSGLLGFSWKK